MRRADTAIQCRRKGVWQSETTFELWIKSSPYHCIAELRLIGQSKALSFGNSFCFGPEWPRKICLLIRRLGSLPRYWVDKMLKTWRDKILGENSIYTLVYTFCCRDRENEQRMEVWERKLKVKDRQRWDIAWQSTLGFREGYLTKWSENL